MPVAGNYPGNRTGYERVVSIAPELSPNELGHQRDRVSMPRTLRVALGSVQPAAETQFVAWALLKALCSAGLSAQHFLSRACFVPYDGATPAAGRPSRHLDSWLMSREECIRAYLRGASPSEFVLVEGHFPRAEGLARLPGGDLETLCQWLNLPRLVVIDVDRLSTCLLPELPANTAGILLDRVSGREDFARWQTILEPLWNVPVMGALGRADAARAAISALPRGETLPGEHCLELARELTPYTRLDRICQLADRPPVRNIPQPTRLADEAYRPRVAVAFDEAFRCYFPDTLEMLERCGATVVAFSPLRDGRLPSKTDIVYFGCGHPERHARALADNHCMMLALKEHVCSGRRLYAEGGGLAYLCEAMQLPDGRIENMVGIFPAVACVQSHPVPPRPVELMLQESTWLAPRGTQLRGYLNSNWQLEPTAAWAGKVTETTASDVLFSRRSAVGSLAHLHFSTNEACFSSFFRPHAAERQLVEV